MRSFDSRCAQIAQPSAKVDWISASGEVPIEREGFGEQLLRHLRVEAGQAIEVPAAAPDQVGERQLVLPLAADAALLGPVDANLEMRDELGDHLLQGVSGDRFIERKSMRPDRMSALGLGEGNCQPVGLSYLVQAALQQILGAEGASDQVAIGSLRQREARAARDHRQPADARQALDQLLADAFGKIVVAALTRDIGEWQHGECRMVVEAGRHLRQVEDMARQRRDGVRRGRRLIAGCGLQLSVAMRQFAALLAQPLLEPAFARNVDAFEKFAARGL